MAKCVVDSASDSAQGGFTSDGSPITGVSCYHDSGVGSTVSLGNFQLFPFPSCPGDDIDNCPYPKQRRSVGYVNDSITAEPGYFSIGLSNGITVDMTSTDHAGLLRFTFPSAGEAAGSPLIMMDLTDGSNSRQDNASVAVDATTGRMTGGGRFLPSFGVDHYQAFFCVDFQGAGIRDNGIIVDSRASPDVKSLLINRGINGSPLLGAGFVRFSNASTVSARLGLSFLSSDRACQNAEAEIPDFGAFDAIRQSARQAWAAKLAPITVSRNAVDPGFLTNFYSGVYRTMVQPQNYTGENPLWQSAEPYWDSFYWCAPGSQDGGADGG